MNTLVSNIQDFLVELAKKMGPQIPIPPRVGDMIEERRRMKSYAHELAETFSDKHTGWMPVFNQLHIDDIMTRMLLCKELAEEWDVPMSFMMTFDFHIYSEPARMYVINRGMMPLIWENKSTPQLLRIAWDGAFKGLWDVEDVLVLPPPIEPLDPDADVQMSNDIAAWFVGDEPL